MVTEFLDIASLDDRPSSIAQEHIHYLQKQSDRMPWCSTFRVLLARGYSNEESYLQNKYLRLAATYTGDKEALFKFMTSDDNKEEVFVPALHDAEIVKEDAQTLEETPEAKENITQKIDTKEVNLKEGISSDSDTIEVNSEEIGTTDIPSGPELEQEEVVAQNSEEKTSIDFESIVTYDPIKELEPIDLPQTKNEHLSLDYVAYNPEEELNKLIVEKKEEEEHNFLFWINHMEDEDDEIKNSSKSPDHVQNLLDQFLATKRSRPIQNREFYKAESKAEESETDNMEVVSETLLELYVKQEHYAKAIKGYEKLSLQNPDKSAYFAARIKEIQHNQS